MREVTLEPQVLTAPPVRMASFVVRALVGLVFYDLVLTVAGFPRIRALVRRSSPRNKPTNSKTIERICNAVDIASCFYFKQVRCMHRSFVVVRLLRKAGVNADLVIGSRPIPFISHAWVEVDGRVVNDKQGYKRRLIEMDRM
jgi:hypothetical protein